MKGCAEQKLFPDEAGFEPASSRTCMTTQPFNAIAAIQANLDQRSRLMDYLNNRSNVRPDIPLSCHGECILAKWLHGEHGKACTNRELLDSLCKNCEALQEAAAQTVLLADLERPELATAIAESIQRFDDASEKYQTNLAELHVECWHNELMAR